MYNFNKTEPFMNCLQIFYDFFLRGPELNEAEARAAYALQVLSAYIPDSPMTLWRLAPEDDIPLLLAAHPNGIETSSLNKYSFQYSDLWQENTDVRQLKILSGAWPDRLFPGTDRPAHVLCLPLGLETPPIRFLCIGSESPHVHRENWLSEQGRLTAKILGLWLGDARHSESAWRQLLAENNTLRGKLGAEYGFPKLIGNSQAMRTVYEQVAQVAPVETTVLLRGESGTGKELIAEAIHKQSIRQHKPFIRINSAAIPESLIESEFFGHERGAFTGAIAKKKGRFEQADGGTLFLDEIGELTPATQAKLLRVLQEQTFERVGGTASIRVNVRIIAATNANLEKMITDGRFREDLYYRLNVFSIYLPALRERKADILLLADHFLFKYARKHHKNVQRISTPAIDALMRYHWPGNVRELENVMERSILVCQDQVIHGYHLPPTLQTSETSGTMPQRSFAESVALHEKELIVEALKASRGNRARAARLLQITERIIGYKINKLQIDVNRYKP